MKHEIRTAIACVGLMAWAGVSLAQHEGHQMGSTTNSDSACPAHAKESLRIVENANRQLEEVRQTNSPQRMRAAMGDLQAALAEVRTHLSLCAEAVSGAQMDESMQGMDHSAMGQEKPAAPKSEKPPSAQMDHSKMGQGKSAAPKSEKPPSAQMDHSKMGSGKPAASSAAPAKDLVDPVCGAEVGPQTTEKATYQGKTYYFCSRADREKFLSDPAAYVKR